MFPFRYSVATYYLNGHLLGTHATGYTSAIFRLDNTTGLQFGAGSENILAIFIDATKSACTGWWCVRSRAHVLAALSNAPHPPTFRHKLLFPLRGVSHVATQHLTPVPMCMRMRVCTCMCVCN